jgi:hypothetical protein
MRIRVYCGLRKRNPYYGLRKRNRYCGLRNASLKGRGQEDSNLRHPVP